MLLIILFKQFITFLYTTIYRRRGSVARNHTIIIATSVVFRAILSDEILTQLVISINGINATYEPPRNSSEVIEDISTIEQYSPRKNQNKRCSRMFCKITRY